MTDMKLPRIRTTLAGLCLLAPLAAPTGIHAQDVVELEAADRWMETGFEEVYRVGVQFGESWEMFGSVARVAFDAQGNLYVFDRGGDLRVLVFDRSGTFLREFGTAGEGPGEFRFPTAYAVMRDGTTIVGDMGSQGYHVFDESGGSRPDRAVGRNNRDGRRRSKRICGLDSHRTGSPGRSDLYDRERRLVRFAGRAPGDWQL